MEHENQYYMHGWIYKTTLRFSWVWEPSLSSSIGWNSNTGAAVLWAPSNSRGPRGLILLAAPSWNRRPSFGLGQCGKWKQRTLYRARNHTDCTLREIENKKKIRKIRQSKCKKTCFSHYWALSRETEVSSKNSWSQALVFMKVGCPVFVDGKTQVIMWMKMEPCW